jgi:hypothetical protein
VTWLALVAARPDPGQGMAYFALAALLAGVFEALILRAGRGS